MCGLSGGLDRDSTPVITDFVGVPANLGHTCGLLRDLGRHTVGPAVGTGQRLVLRRTTQSGALQRSATAQDTVGWHLCRMFENDRLFGRTSVATPRMSMQRALQSSATKSWGIVRLETPGAPGIPGRGEG